jgi:hypothetical protein
MAYIIGDDYEGKFIDTEVQFTDGDQALNDFFAKTRRAPNTILKATWFTGTPILPEVVPTTARIIEGDALYDWRTVHGGPTLVSARFKDCVEELDPGRHGFFPLTVEDKKGLPGPDHISCSTWSDASTPSSRRKATSTSSAAVRSMDGNMNAPVAPGNVRWTPR